MSVETKKSLVVDIARIEQLVTALSFASTDMFDHPNAQVSIAAEDEFGTLESAFAVFLAELAEAKAELRKTVEEVAASRDELQAKLTTIEQQQQTIRELGTPILEIAHGVLTLPVVGAIDAERATEMTEELLERIVQKKARAVILDITGVEVVDTLTADHLVRLTRSAELLGTRCIVTGISPAVAQTLMSMGGGLGDVRTLRTLRDGLRACLEEEGLRR